MTKKRFKKNINLRQIIIHCIAAWFFILAFKTLFYLNNPKLFYYLNNSKEQDIFNALKQSGFLATDLAIFAVWTSVAGSIGLLVALIFSLMISIKHRWFWLNVIISFVLIFMLDYFNLLGFTYAQSFCWFVGDRFGNITIELIVNGSILLTIGLLLFFLKKVNGFIEKGYKN